MNRTSIRPNRPPSAPRLQARSPSWRSLSFLVAGFLVLAAIAVALAQEPSNPILYGYDGLSTGVLEVRFLSDTLPETVEFTVFADGRVHCQIVGTGPDRRVYQEYSDHLDAVEVRHLVDDAVTSGLVDFDTARFFRQQRDRGRSLPQGTDLGAIHFKINLSFLARGSEPSESPFSHTFLLDNPTDLERVFPEQRELRALRRITDVLEQISRTHRGRR